MSKNWFVGNNIIWLRHDTPNFTVHNGGLSLLGLIDYVEGIDYLIEAGDGVQTKIYHNGSLLAAFIFYGKP